MKPNFPTMSRRGFVGVIAPITFASLFSDKQARAASPGGAARWRIPLVDDWLFGGARVTLPHCVSRLSWQDWNPASWQNVWEYRRPFSLPRGAADRRVFLEFDGVMTSATPSINGHALPTHRGGYLPFRYEITDFLTAGDQALTVAVDSRWQNVPPDGSQKGPDSVDYLEPGGIIRPVSLSIVPAVYISGVFAKPIRVLESDRRVEVTCTVDAAVVPRDEMQLHVEMVDGTRVVATAQQAVKVSQVGLSEIPVTLSKLGNVGLWDNDHPQLYTVVTTLLAAGKPVHDYRVRIGFREARFELDGFFLNGKRLQLFGLNRHEIYPYAGCAMPRRVMHRDAEILRRDFNCNIVRCSHYPQSEAFLEACDELGLMVWEETPGWGYLGDEVFQEQVVTNVTDMILRDRNHASIVIWGVRVNESRNEPALYTRTTEIAHRLDGTRPASGSMTPGSSRNWKTDWKEDVFAFDDYHSAEDGGVGIREPVEGFPYLLAEAVGQFNYSARKNFNAKYVRGGDDVALLETQAVRHAQAHDRARAFPRCCGVIAWCAFDYSSLVNAYRAVKTPGVADVFRIPKPGAAFYQVQVSPAIRPMIVPGFFWEFGATAHGPGKQAAIFSNCERLDVFVDGQMRKSLRPDRAGFPHTTYPPFFCDLDVDGTKHPELRIDGYVGERKILSRSFSSDRSRDVFAMKADDEDLAGDGVDATRVTFAVIDGFGSPRAHGSGEVRFEITGPGSIIGDNSFLLAGSGGVAAVWVKSSKGSGLVTLTAVHSTLGRRSVAIRVA